MTFKMFCEKMTDAINTEAMMTGNAIITTEEVMTMPEAITAYTATVYMTSIIKSK